MATFPFTGDPQSLIEMIYVGYFGRAGDPVGTTYWQTNGNTGTGAGLTAIAASFSVQPEAKTDYVLLANPLAAGTTVSFTSPIGVFLNSVYENLFGRAVDSAGLTYWGDAVATAIASGNTTTIATEIGQIILQIALGAQNTLYADQTVLAAKVTVADTMTTDFSNAGITFTNNGSTTDTFAQTLIAGITPTNDTASAIAVADSAISAFISLSPPPSSETFTLTTAVDNFAGGPNATFVGTYSDGGIGGGNTFQIGDTLIGLGGANTNTLIITPNIAIGGGSAATSLVDTIWANISGIENVSVTTGAGAINIATGTDFNTAFDAAGVNLTATSTGGAITINMSGATFEGLVASVAFTGAETITAITTGAGAQNIATGSGAATVTATAAAGAQTIFGADLTTVTATDLGAGAQTITSTGAGSVTVHANGNGGLQTITTGAGNDIIILNSSASLATINAGTGNDTITLGATHTGVDTIQFGPAALEVVPTPWTATNTVSPTGVDTITNFTGALDILAFSTATFGNGSAVGVAPTNIGVYANTTTALNTTNADIIGTNLAALAGHQSIVLVGSNTVGSTVDVYIENAGGNIGLTVAQELAANEIVLVAHVTIVGAPLTAGDFSSIA